MPELTVTVDPKIKDAKSAVTELTNFIRNPPKTPLDAVRFFASQSGIGAAVSGLSKNLSSIPGIGALSSLISLVDMFSGGPSIGELTLQAISDVSNQISAATKEIIDQIQQQTEAARVATIDTILSGVDEISRQQSAVQVINALTTSSIIDEQVKAFDEARAEFQQELDTARGAVLQELQSKAQAVSADVDKVYDQYVSQVAEMLAQLAPYLLDAFNSLVASLETPQVSAPGISAPVVSRSIESGQSAPKSESDNSTTWLVLGGGILLFLFLRKKH